jgi:hypothetical protein
MEELKPCPSQWDAAVNYLNAYRNSHYADTMTEDSYWLADAINTILPFAVNAYRRAAPANEALTLDELRKMDGEPVWIVEAPDWGHWELSEHAEDYLDDRDPDFYGMKHDDPAGRYGLHVLGWLAYARRPEAAP